MYTVWLFQASCRVQKSSKSHAPAHLRFREKKRCESAIPVIFPPIGQKSYVYKAWVFANDNIRYFIVNQEKFRKP